MDDLERQFQLIRMRIASDHRITEKPKEDNQFTYTPSYKELWEQWTETEKADFLEDLYKEQATHCICLHHHRLQLGDKFILDKTKYRLLPIKETETESTVEYKVVEI